MQWLKGGAIVHKSYAIWVPSDTGRHLLTFESYDLAVLYVIRFGGGLEIIENKYEKY
jgi:hypothetical protein